MKTYWPLLLFLFLVACRSLNTREVALALNSTSKKRIEHSSEIRDYLPKDWTEIMDSQYDRMTFRTNLPFEGGEICELQGFKAGRISYYFLTFAGMGILIEPEINGAFVLCKGDLWFLYGGIKTDIKQSVQRNSFEWKQIISAIKMKRGEFLKPEFKLTFLRNGEIYYSVLSCPEAGLAYEYFFKVGQEKALSNPFNFCQKSIKRNSKSDPGHLVEIEYATDCYFWLHSNYLPSEPKYYPDLDYDYGEIQK
jgi:hypothetical protein